MSLHTVCVSCTATGLQMVRVPCRVSVCGTMTVICRATFSYVMRQTVYGCVAVRRSGTTICCVTLTICVSGTIRQTVTFCCRTSGRQMTSGTVIVLNVVWGTITVHVTYCGAHAAGAAGACAGACIGPAGILPGARSLGD